MQGLFDSEYLKLDKAVKQADKELRKLSQKEKTIMNLREKDYARYSRLSDQIDEDKHKIHLRYNKILQDGLDRIEKKKKKRD